MSVALTTEELLAEIAGSGNTPRLLLHCCCAPCSSYVLEYLSPFFRISALFFNPNIKPSEEYDKRAGEMERLIELASYPNFTGLLVSDHNSAVFDAAAEPFMDEPEGGRRCRACFELRLGETAGLARDDGYDYFASTLSVSPHKDAALINDTGVRLAAKSGVRYLQSDFKKHGGYKRSVELSAKYGLYRQNYCGCRSR